MSLFMDFMEDCIRLDKTHAPDGMGGSIVEFSPGAPFIAAVVKDSTIAALVAEKQGVTQVYLVTTPPGVGLEYHDVFRRLSDGATFRVTSNYTDSRPPKTASFAFEQVRAERWDLPA